jgi:hypothetical protein
MSIVSSRFSLFRGDELVDSLWRRRLTDGTWHCQSQLPTGRPEATAWVLLALCERYDWAGRGRRAGRSSGSSSPTTTGRSGRTCSA